MRLKADDFLEPVLPFLRETLVAPAAIAAIRALARQLPPAQSGGFECRLGEAAPEADFALCYVPAGGSTGISAAPGHWNQAIIDTITVSNPAWEGVRSLFMATADPASPLGERIRNIWLEFDMGHALPGVPLPGVFFSLNNQRQGQELLVQGLKLLAGGSWPAYLTANLARCFAALPSSARIAYVGKMLSRRASGVRLCINGLAPEAILAYLHTIGWTGPGAELAEVLAGLSCFAHKMIITMDVDQEVELKLGLECYLDNPRYARVLPEWPRFLEYLVQHGLCLPEKREALLAWPGYSSRPLFGTCIFPRGLNHIKLVYHPHQPLEAKAYLSFWNGWIQPRPAT